MKAREIHLGMWIGNFARDSWLEVRFGIRILLKNPGLTIPAVLILALGIGVNASLFSLVNTLLLKPVGIRDPEQVVGCYSRDISQPGGGYRPFSYPNYKDLQANSSVFVDLAHTNHGPRNADPRCDGGAFNAPCDAGLGFRQLLPNPGCRAFSGANIHRRRRKTEQRNSGCCRQLSLLEPEGSQTRCPRVTDPDRGD